MSEENRKPERRRVILPEAKKPELEVTVIPTLDILMNDAMSIIGHQLALYRSRLKKHPAMILDTKEAKSVQAYMEALIKLSRENREIAKQYDFGDMTPEELEAELQKLKELDNTK